jgi:sugar (pentulose or hexulose) kinase
LALWDAVVNTLRQLSARLGAEDRVLGLALSSQGGTTIPLDAAMQPVYNAISWMDQRARVEFHQVEESFGAEAIYRLTGWPLMPALPLMHIRWLHVNQPDAFARARYFTFVNDYIGYRLAGELCMDPSDASITQLLDISRGDWDGRLLELAGIRSEQLSPVQRSGLIIGDLSSEASLLTGLPQGLPLVNGAHDQYCAAVGLGVTRPGPMLLSTGTAWVFLLTPPDLESGLKTGMAVSCHAARGQWGALRSLGGVGSSLEWLLERLWNMPGLPASSLQSYRDLDEAASTASPGATGLLFFPLAGGHAETYGMGVGGFVGLTLNHTRADLARAALEGVAFELRWAIEEIGSAGVHVDEMIMVGGAARSSIWSQIVADICGVRLSVPPVTQAAGWGAAVLAGLGCSLFPSLDAAPQPQGEARRFAPLPEHRAAYENAYRRYRQVLLAFSRPASNPQEV